jgi:GntR family transcriptional regulator
MINGIKRDLALGLVLPGERLPPVRELAATTALNPNTIARAYQEMERLGLIETRRGRGTFVAAAPPFDSDEAEITISELVEKILIEAANAGIGKERLLSLITEKVEKWFIQRGGSGNGAGD